jgi:hypothetical protein
VVSDSFVDGQDLQHPKLVGRAEVDGVFYCESVTNPEVVLMPHREDRNKQAGDFLSCVQSWHRGRTDSSENK